MRTVIFDIETSGHDLDALSLSQQEYIFREAEKENNPDIKERKKDDAVRLLSLYPFTAKIAAAGMLEADTGKSAVYYLSEEKEEWEDTDKHRKFYGVTEEEEVLESFWKVAAKMERFVSFNGRGFDLPFLMLRSAVLRIKPTRNLMTGRYETGLHVDLLDQLTFYGCYRKFNLDFYCHGFGIESSKDKGITGKDIKKLFDSGRRREIAQYCAEDIRATFELFQIWKEYLSFPRE